MAGPQPAYQWQFNNTNLPGATNATLTLLDAWPPDTGSYQVIATNAVGTITSAPVTLTIITATNLGLAVDAPLQLWQSGGQLPWVPTNLVAHDGLDSARSGAISDGTNSWMETLFAGPGTLQFWWKVSSEPGFDPLRLLVNGAEQAWISGEVDWQQQTINLGGGNQTVRWEYDKDSTGSLGQDSAWVDAVSFVPTNSIAPHYLTARKVRQGQFRFTLTGESDGHFSLLRSTNLANWTPLLTITNTSGNSFLTTPVSNAPAGAYFRGQRLP